MEVMSSDTTHRFLRVNDSSLVKLQNLYVMVQKQFILISEISCKILF